jgi:hypothetical protein
MEGLNLYYNGYLPPLIDYCSVVWGNTNKVNFENIEHKYSGAKLLIHLNIRVALW